MSLTIKKYNFFEEISVISEIKNDLSCYSLSELSVNEIIIFKSSIFLSCKIKKQNQKREVQNEVSIFKVQGQNIFYEFNNLYNKSIFSFHLSSVENSTYLFSLGLDFKEVSIGNDKTFLMIYSVKVVLYFSSKHSHKVIKSINLMRYTNQEKLYLGEDFIPNIEPVSNIICFNVSTDGSLAAVGLEKGEVILITGIFNIKHSLYLIKLGNQNEPITNVAFTYNNILYVSTTQDIYYYDVMSSLSPQKNKPVEVNPILRMKSLSIGWGAVPKGLGVFPKENRISIVSPLDGSICEYTNYEKGSTLLLEGSKNYLGIYKNTLVLSVSNSPSSSSLVLFDKVNGYYVFEQAYQETKILSISLDPKNNSIFLLRENLSKSSSNKKEIVIIRELNSKEKINQFYQNNDYITAITYAKNDSKSFPKNSISEIYYQYGNYYFSKGDYSLAVKEYLKTLKKYPASEIINKFSVGGKIDYLIEYLEGLINTIFVSSINIDKEKNYIALLLNCYIKQKKFNRMKEFVANAYMHQQRAITRYAIDICKETNQIELATQIAEKGKLNDILVEVFVEMSHDYASGISYLEKEKNLKMQFDLVLKYGDVLLMNCPKELMGVIKSLVSRLIKLREKSQIVSEKMKEEIKNCSYEKLMSIFYVKETEDYCNEFLTFAIQNDKSVSKEVLHKKIELLLSKYSTVGDEKSKTAIKDGIYNLIKNKVFQGRIDCNHLLILFHMHEFLDGIILIHEIMENNQELLQIYMKTNNYEKIMMLCNNYGKEDMNIYLQSLNYFIDTYNESNKGEFEKNINEILHKLLNSEHLNSILLMEVAKRMKGKIKFKQVKGLIQALLLKKIEQLKSDAKEKEKEVQESAKLKQKIAETKRKKTIVLKKKCDLCERPIRNESYICFVCKHTYHYLCLVEINSEVNEIDCIKCRNKHNILTKKIRQTEENADDHNTFFMELKSKEKKFDLIAKYLSKGVIKTNQYFVYKKNEN